MNERERAIRQRLKDDFEHYAQKCLKIRPKRGAIRPLELNEAQRYIHQRIEQQLAETGKVRAAILKGRQQGASTYVGGRFYQKVTHRKGVRAFILTHQDDATKNLFEMTERYHEHCPALVKPTTSTSNAKELTFDRLDSGYKVATAGSKGAGRSSTIQYFHGSEVAYWPNAEKHAAGALQAVPNEPGTEVILESTSDGPSGYFYEICKAAEAGQGDFILIFVPWHWQREYRQAPPADFKPTEEEKAYAAKFDLDWEQIAWRRAKIVELRGAENFRREYPSDVQEAFTADAKGAMWKRTLLNRNRVEVGSTPPMERMGVAIDPAVSNKKDSAETGIAVGGVGWCACKGKPELHGFLFEDASLQASVEEWADRGVEAYQEWEADFTIGEKNNGGDLVEMALRHVDPNIPYEGVTASRGKVTRNEPIAQLDAQGKIHHVGIHPALEDQMCTWRPAIDKSPDRIDARTWLFWKLLIDSGLTDDTAQAGGEVAPEPDQHVTSEWEF